MLTKARETPNCAICKWAHVKDDKFGLRITYCTCQGGHDARAVYFTDSCRELYARREPIQQEPKP
jgi:hypothetical protein